MNLSQFVKPQPEYFVESGYGISDLWGTRFHSALKALAYASQEHELLKSVTIWRGNKIISLETLQRDAQQE